MLAPTVPLPPVRVGAGCCALLLALLLSAVVVVARASLRMLTVDTFARSRSLLGSAGMLLGAAEPHTPPLRRRPAMWLHRPQHGLLVVVFVVAVDRVVATMARSLVATLAAFARSLPCSPSRSLPLSPCSASVPPVLSSSLVLVVLLVGLRVRVLFALSLPPFAALLHVL